MEIYTSYFGNFRALAKENVLMIGIARFPPRYFNGESIMELAPHASMLRMGESEYVKMFEGRILAKLNQDDIVRKIGEIAKRHGCDKVALCCFEKPGEFCHRRLFAEWLKEKTGYEIKEFGYTEKKGPDVVQGSLF